MGGRDKKRRVSFDLLAEMAYALPEEPISPILVEVGTDWEQQDDIGDICDGTSTCSEEEEVKGDGKCDGGDLGSGGGGSGMASGLGVKVVLGNGTQSDNVIMADTHVSTHPKNSR